MGREVDRERRREAEWRKSRAICKAPQLFSSQGSNPQRPVVNSTTVSPLQHTSSGYSYILTTVEEPVQERPEPLLAKDTVSNTQVKCSEMVLYVI